MEITIKTNNGLELAGMFAEMMAGRRIPEPAFSLPQEEEEQRKEADMEEEASRIREILACSRMSKSAFAKKYGIPYSTIQKWTDGNRIPPEYVINLLERAVRADSDLEDLRKKHNEDLRAIATGEKKLKYKGKADV